MARTVKKNKKLRGKLNSGCLEIPTQSGALDKSANKDGRRKERQKTSHSSGKLNRKQTEVTMQNYDKKKPKTSEMDKQEIHSPLFLGI